MKLSISKKFAKRSIKCLALFAPLAYLFGSLFFGLNGAHGGFPFSADYDVLVDYEYVEWNQLVRNSYPTYSTGGLTFSADENGFSVIGTADDSWRTTTYQSPFLVYSIPNTDSWICSGFDGHSKITLSSIGNSYNGGFVYYYSQPVIKNTGYGVFRLSFVIPEGTVFDNEYFYNPYFVNLSKLWPVDTPTSIYDVRSQWVLNRLVDVHDYNTGENVAYAEYSTPDNSQYLFNQFFAKDNFLQQWGENAISDNPKGFAPFGSFFKLLDDNIFHLSDSQIGLMAYGYLYYCLHVLIACLVFDIVAFIPLFVQRVQDKLGGKEDD